MNRRNFLQSAITVAASGAMQMAASGTARALAFEALWEEIPADLKITRITGMRLTSHRPKLVGRNSRLDVHGRTGGDFLWWVDTTAGLQGLGAARDQREAAGQLIGRSVREMFRPSDRSLSPGAFGRGDMPLWDLVAKALNKPAYELFGGKGPSRIPVYDGSIYFADLLPEFADRGVARILEEIDDGIKRGHRAFKVKVGRGAKWMDRDEGDRRDIEVLNAIRKHAGPDVTIFIDANNGYDLAGTKRFFAEIGPLNIGFAEEMFPEQVQQDLELKAFFKEHGWSTLVADGESADGPKHFEPYVAARALDVLQPDMKAFGFGLQLEMDRLLQGTDIRLAPHNWGSLVGFYMQLHLGRGITTFFRAEHDPLSTPALVADGYRIEQGTIQVPDTPGFGLELRPDAAGDDLKQMWVV